MQAQLDSAYELFKTRAEFSDELSVRLSCPLLVNVPDRWLSSEKRVLVVGQETLGWGFASGSYYDWPYAPIPHFKEFKKADNSVEALVTGYKLFEFARFQPENYRSPFWQAYRQIRLALGDQKDGMETRALWTNLFKMSLDGGSVLNGRPTDVALIRDANVEVFHQELQILQPTHVVFFTGPDYDPALKAILSGVELKKFGDHEQSRVAQLAHPLLPSHTWRTYHPKYLSLSKQWGIIDEIVARVIGD